ncbi:hypothetical protein [Sphingorhabdus sp. SMR4y]|uniref:hypothetical protein n=1 Tax=Sphingorhabdus sp. SMR4y TaxID=2584094 RepID=UPI000B5C9D6D|nr:hypothetical protein [Sphingorhabdus sp. SMR4y]ASK87566.1 hypothetical protein SPHFLASMR4Y_00785 [Sphingorhabdus sp. SMR4y]ASK89341.1 hypothetical protein SPHFLASMR4Y_02603 [Sphingorhabdus sp. SMR4y]
MSSEAMQDERPHVIRDARGKRPQFYDTPGMDQVMSMIMVLAGELCVVRDRLDAAERVARDNGLDLAAGIEALKLDDKALEEREARRQDLLARMYALMRKEAHEASERESEQAYRETIEDIARR